jgi:hypothetical protein
VEEHGRGRCTFIPEVVYIKRRDHHSPSLKVQLQYKAGHSTLSQKYREDKGLPLPAISAMNQLCGTIPDKGRATRTHRFAIGTPLRWLNMDVEEFRAVLAVAQLIFRVHVAAASGARQGTPSLRMIDIEPVTARPTFVHLDVTIAVIDHVRRTTFAAYHLISPLD